MLSMPHSQWQVDKQLVDLIVEQQKPVLFVVNKWDLYAGDVERSEWAQYLRDTFRTMPRPIAFVTATTGRNVKLKLTRPNASFAKARLEFQQLRSIQLFMLQLKQHAHPLIAEAGLHESTLRHSDTAPPTIVLSTSSPESLTAPYKRYLLSSLERTHHLLKCRSHNSTESQSS